jgi:hypothetical protein
MIISVLHSIIQILNHEMFVYLGIIHENQMPDPVQFLYFNILRLFPLVIIFLRPGGGFEARAFRHVKCIYLCLDSR